MIYMNRTFLAFSVLLTLGLAYFSAPFFHTKNWHIGHENVAPIAAALPETPEAKEEAKPPAQKTAQLRTTLTQSNPPHASWMGCLPMAATTYHVPPDVLRGIMSVEGGRIGQSVGPNVNGTYDLGPMQVNSLWVPRLARMWGVDYHTAYHAIRDNGCENVYIGTWILKQKIVETGGLYSGVAAYHSATRQYGHPYADKVARAMKRVGPAPQLLAYRQ